jgi:hypothetical protein
VPRSFGQSLECRAPQFFSRLCFASINGMAQELKTTTICGVRKVTCPARGMRDTFVAKVTAVSGGSSGEKESGSGL